MKYTLQEGSFSLFPAGWQDASMNILRDEQSGLSVVVSRGIIPDGSNAEQEFHRQWEMLRTQMGEISQSAFTPVMAGPQRDLPGTEVETAFERNGQRLWQKQLAVQAVHAFGPASVYRRGRRPLGGHQTEFNAEQPPGSVRHER